MTNPGDDALFHLAQEINAKRLNGDLKGAANATDQAVRLLGRSSSAPVLDRIVLSQSIGSIRKSQGRLGEALEHYEEALRLSDAEYGPTHQFTEVLLRAVGDTHYLAGRYDEARSYCLRALEITDGDTSPARAFGLQLLARIHSALGNVAAAVEANDAAGTLHSDMESHGAPTELTRAANISQSAIYAVKQGAVLYGIRLHWRAMRIRRRHAGRHHPVVAESHVALAMAYDHFGLLRRLARRHLLKALRIYRAAGNGADRLRLASAYLDLGQIEFRLQKTGAMRSTEAGLSIAVDLLGEYHPIVGRGRVLRARLLLRQGQPGDALAQLLETSAGQSRLLGPAFGATAEAERLAFLATTRREIRDRVVEIALTHLPCDPASLRGAFRLVAQWTGLTLEMALRQKASVRAGQHPELRSSQERLAELDTMIADGLVRAGHVPASDMRAWVRERQQIEVMIAGAVREARQALYAAELNLDELAAALPTDSCLVQYVRYRRVDVDEPGERYAAFVMTAAPVNALRVTDLGPAEALDGLVTRYRRSLTPLSPRAVRVRAANRSADPEAARWVFAAVVAPLLPLPEPASHLIVVPDGAINLVPLSAVILAGDDPALKDLTVSYLSTPKDLLRAPTLVRGGPPVVLGDPDYGVPDWKPRRGRGLRPFTALPGTRQEAEAVGALLGVAPITGVGAVAACLDEQPSPRVLHLATHGFTLNEITEEHPKGMLRSGIAFAGANNTREGGILTPEQVAALDLTGTRLVVASACSTSLGMVHDAEGAFGLHRAFLLAGAATVVASLWEVPDAATVTLMRLFYTRYLNSGDAAAALCSAQRQLAESGRPAEEWGAFVCHGWTPLGEGGPGAG